MKLRSLASTNTKDNEFVNIVHIFRLTNKKLGYRWQTARRNGVADLLKHPLPICVTTSNLVVLRQRVCA